MQPDIDSAIAQGVPVITIDSDADSSKRLLFIGTDNYKAGMMGGEVVAKQLNGKGNVVIYTMPEQANLNQRLRGYQDAFKPHPQIKITQIVDIKGDARIAFDTTKEILAKGSGKVDALICLEAIACAEVAEVLNRERVMGKVVVAMDTDQRTLEWIEKGSITATIGQKPFTMSFYGIKMLDDLHHHKFGQLSNTEDSFSPIPSFVDTGATLIDKGNIGRYLKERESAISKP
jgi:ribose transport system substrate-binding protein